MGEISAKSSQALTQTLAKEVAGLFLGASRAKDEVSPVISEQKVSGYYVSYEL